jgi:branched-chain amino acid transport system permease protein
VFVDFSILWSEFASLLLDGIVVGAIYALVALGYTLVYGVLRLINFAHSEIFMIGTFASLGVTMMLGFTGFEEPLGILAFLGVFLLVATVAGVASGSAAMLLEVVAYRRLRRNNANRLASLISAIGASLFLVEIFRIITDSKDWDFPRLLEKNSLFEVSTAYFTVDKIVVLFGAFGLMFFLDRIIQTTKLGRGIRAVSQDEKTAILMLAGVGSAFYMLFYEATKFNVGFLLGISAFTAAVLGGIGNIRGALAGSFALGIIQQFSSAVLGYNWRDVVTFLILVLVLLFKPTGLFGESLQRARV